MFEQGKHHKEVPGEKKKVYKNEEVTVKGIRMTRDIPPQPIDIKCLVTNDEIGKTLSIITPNDEMYTIAFEPLEEYLR